MGWAVEVCGIRSRAHSVMRMVNEVMVQTVAVAQVMIATGIVVLVYGLMDREPPFELLEVYPSHAKAGQMVTIKARVKRDLDRGCDADFSRYMWGMTPGPDLGQPIETRFVLGTSHAPAAMIEMMDKKWPGGLVISERVPETLLPGPAKITADIYYTCNKAHYISPIKVHMEMPFTIVP